VRRRRIIRTMRTAIAVTLLFAGLTPALGAQMNAKRLRSAFHPFFLAGTFVSGAMALWFIIAAYWSLIQAYPDLALPR
jgi:ABC-type arginine transport system permease subunit